MAESIDILGVDVIVRAAAEIGPCDDCPALTIAHDGGKFLIICRCRDRNAIGCPLYPTGPDDPLGVDIRAAAAGVLPRDDSSARAITHDGGNSLIICRHRDWNTTGC